MGSYLGKHAEYYDIFYQEKPYGKEAAFIDQLIQRYKPGSKLLLELACGSGRHAFELERLGYQIVATDYSADLLKVANRNAQNLGSKVRFVLQDMRTLNLPEKSFDVIYSLFDSIGYVQTNSAIGKVFNCVWAHLGEQGIFIFEFWHAAAMLRSFEPVRERRWQMPSGELVRIARTKLNVATQLAEVTYEISELKDGNTTDLVETQVNRYFLVQEMKSYLENHGFEVLEFLPAYESGDIDENTWHVLSVARKVQE
jgi:SAM-dependent methyltransferase